MCYVNGRRGKRSISIHRRWGRSPPSRSNRASFFLPKAKFFSPSLVQLHIRFCVRDLLMKQIKKAYPHCHSRGPWWWPWLYSKRDARAPDLKGFVFIPDTISFRYSSKELSKSPATLFQKLPVWPLYITGRQYDILILSSFPFLLPIHL